MSVSIRDTDTTTADFAEGTLTDVVAVNDGLELVNNPALSFDGVDDYVEVADANSLDIVDQLTLEAWFYVPNGDLPKTYNTTFRSIVSKGDTVAPYSINWYAGSSGTPDNRLQSEITTVDQGRVSITAYSKLNYGAWNHNAIVYDGNSLKSYINGELTGSTVASGGIVTNTKPLYIGFAGSDRYYWGNIDDVRIWNTVRTQTEIQDNMNTELTGSETGLVAYYKMNEGSGTTLTDSAGTNGGTINGATWTVDNTRYLTTGTRQSPQLDLSPVGTVKSGSINWQETLNSQTITIETSVDGGSTWDTCTNGGSIPNISGASTLDVRQTLSTTDTTVTPRLESLEVDIDTAVVNEDTGVLQETETHTFYPFKFNDTGTLISDMEYNQEGWITIPKNTADWKKVGGE